MLSKLKVKEFSGGSEFQDPAMSYILPDVICSFCKTCKDLDLLRDDGLTNPDVKMRWKCSHCRNGIDTVEIENRLLNEVERMSTTFLLQDLRCPVTHEVSTHLFFSNPCVSPNPNLNLRIP
jgi:DNA polymerase epsilon subunit 1